MIIQTQQIQDLKNQLAVVQVNQVNSTNSVASPLFTPTAPYVIPATISTGSIALTQQFLAAMMQHFITTQIARNKPVEKKKCKFGTHFIPNDKPYGKRTKQ